MLPLRHYHRKREFRRRIRDMGSGQEALSEDETPPGCEADEEENIWIFKLGLDSLHTDGNVDGGRLFFGSARLARHSSLQDQPRDALLARQPFPAANGAAIKRYGEKTIRLQSQGTDQSLRSET